jgi:Fe-S-cluster containining protein
MSALRLDAEQRFSCRSCGRCCRRGWDIALTAAEAAAYRKAGARRWFRERADGPEGSPDEPSEPVPGRADLLRLRKRDDGACGFLSPENRCRIHEELGAERKPLSCRLFPLSFHGADGPTLVTASFSCPSVVEDRGEPLAQQLEAIAALRKAWFREQGAPAPRRAPELEYVRGRSLAGASLGALRRALREMLDRPGPSGRPDLRAGVARMAATLEDLSRHRVVRLPAAAFAEYLELTASHAARTEKPLAPRPPGRLGRLLFRGFLFVVEAARLQLEDGRAAGLRLGLRLRLAALLAHCHGLWPAVAGVDLAAARRTRVDLEDPALHAVVYHYLRAQLETLGTGRRPVLDEIAVAVAQLDAALVLARMRAARAGRAAVEVSDLREGLMEAADLTHADAGGVLGSLVATLAGGVEALHIFASGDESAGAAAASSAAGRGSA